jgi:hypothetical protein
MSIYPDITLNTRPDHDVCSDVSDVPDIAIGKKRSDSNICSDITEKTAMSELKTSISELQLARNGPTPKNYDKRANPQKL